VSRNGTIIEANDGSDESQFEKIDQRFEKLDQRFEKMDQRFDAIDQRLEGMDQQFVGVNQRLDRVEESIQTLKETIENNASEFRSHFRQIENKLENHDRMFEVVSEEMRRGNWM